MATSFSSLSRTDSQVAIARFSEYRMSIPIAFPVDQNDAAILKVGDINCNCF
jgi:hypothetical protein